MLFKDFQPFFIAAALVNASSVLASFRVETTGVPQHSSLYKVNRRANVPAGLGVEVEAYGVRIQPKQKAMLTPEVLQRIKGVKLTPVNFAGGTQTKWKVTAEIVDKDVMPEVIVDGLRNKVGDLKTKDIEAEIVSYFEAWSPCRDNECQVEIEGFEGLGPWMVEWPKPASKISERRFDSPVTTAMPLSAVREVLKDAKHENTKGNLLASSNSLYQASFIIPTKEDFATFRKIVQAHINDEFLGCFSLLASYCHLSSWGKRSQGPKHLLSVMPRTDLVTQYNIFIEPKLRKLFAESNTSLFDIIMKLTPPPRKGDMTLRDKVFLWSPGIRRPSNVNWPKKDEDLQTGTLAVTKFLYHLQGYNPETKQKVAQLDLLSLMDQILRSGQIGGLGNKMETTFGTNKPASIFEFRDLDPVKEQVLVSTMGSYEEKIIEYHKNWVNR